SKISISFLISLYAETTYLPLGVSFKYSHLIHCIRKVIVTKLKQRSKSAGNFAYFSNESTSETLRDKSILSNTDKKVSVHVPIHSKPLSDNDFGHYLAGLIDGDGHFSNTPQLVIVFNQLDASLAYNIKGRIGYGNIYKVKNKEAVILVVSKSEGLKRVIELINGKIRSDNKLNQINKNILSNPRFINLPLFSKNNDSHLNNHWLAGFSDADASFQIKFISRNQRTEVRLNFQIDQKENTLLILIKNFLGGNIGYRKSQDTYYYGSTSFGSAVKVIHYFDQYHLLSSKHLNYLKWRKAYILLKNKEHLTDSGLDQITKLKKTMNRGNLDTLD
uniref:LAGLIDADG endonuclease n=1 Tax=Pappia fissilis TaxID=1040649 RepID=UPI002A8099EF